jgi:hypothetical protein
MRRAGNNRGLAGDEPAHNAPDQQGTLTARLIGDCVEFGLGGYSVHNPFFFSSPSRGACDVVQPILLHCSDFTNPSRYAFRAWLA